MSVECTVDGNLLIYPCPHCQLLVTTLINDIACGIFRHGFDLTTQTQLPPHASERDCAAGNYVGCRKPYKITKVADKYYVEVCGYI